MDVIINDERVDITLEGESSVEAVLDSIRSWLFNQDYGILETSIDGRAYDENQNLELRSVGQIDIKAEPRSILRLKILESLQDQALIIEEALRSGDIKSISERINLMLDSLSLIDKDLRDKLILGFTNAFSNDKPLANNQDLSAITRDCLTLIRERISEYHDPVEELAKTLKALELILPAMENLSILLQTGKDSEAMHTILVFTEISDKIIRLFLNLKTHDSITKLSIGGMDVESFYTDLNSNLQVLLDAFARKDTVMIGDIAEYEVVPRMRNLVAAITASIMGSAQ